MWRWALVGAMFLGAIYVSAYALIWFFRVLFYIIG
jgi:hypothetical protein